MATGKDRVVPQYLYFTVIIFLIRLLCVTYRFRTTLTKNKQQFETHGFGCVSQQNIEEQATPTICCPGCSRGGGICPNFLPYPRGFSMYLSRQLWQMPLGARGSTPRDGRWYPHNHVDLGCFKDVRGWKPERHPWVWGKQWPHWCINYPLICLLSPIYTCISRIISYKLMNFSYAN